MLKSSGLGPIKVLVKLPDEVPESKYLSIKKIKKAKQPGRTL